MSTAQKQAAPRNHNEWFQSIAKCKCPTCGEGGKRDPVDVYAWGQYITGKWRTIKHFCDRCFKSEVAALLIDHTDDCGCVVTLVARSGHRLPAWIPEQFVEFKAARVSTGKVCT